MLNFKWFKKIFFNQKINGNHNIQAGRDIVFTQDLSTQIDYAKKLLDEYSPDSALKFLEDLKERVWNKVIITSVDKYRILTLIARAKFNMNLRKEAANYYIEAYQYNRTDEKAKISYAFGQFLLGERNIVKSICEDVLSINPQCVDAYAFYLDLYPNDKPAEELLSSIPKNLHNDTTILFGIGMLHARRGNKVEAQLFMEKSVLQDPKKIEYKAALADILLGEAINRQLIVGQEEFKKEKSAQALNLYDEVINIIKDKEINKYKGVWYMHRGTAKGNLKDIRGSIEDLNIALQFNPNDEIVLQNLALAYREDDKIDSAIDILENYKGSNFENRKILLGEFYRFKGEFEKAKENYRFVIDNSKDARLVNDAKKILVVALQQNGEIEEARKINEELQKFNKDDIVLLLNQSELLLSREEKNESDEVLKHAYSLVDDNTNIRYVNLLANALHSSKIYNEASILLKKLSDIDTEAPTYDKINRKLIDCYFKLHKYDKLLEVTNKLRKFFPENDKLAEIETHIYERTGALESAYVTYIDYFKYSSDDLEMQVRFAALKLRMEKFDELDVFLNSDIEYNKLNIEVSIYLAQLFDLRNIHEKFLDLLYEMRRRFYSESEAHSAYITLMMQAGEKNKDLLEVVLVENDTVAFLKNGNTDKFFILENRADADLSKKEICIESEIGKKLNGKKVGDLIELTDSPFGNEKWEIVEIKSKHLHALHESMSIFNEFFPEDKSILKVTIDPKDGVKPTLEKMFTERSDQLKSEVLMKELYKKGNMTIGAMSNFLGRDYFEIFGNLSADPQLGIIVASGTENERILERESIKKSKDLIVDLTFVNTLALLDLTKLKNYPKFKIVQSVKDDISTILIKRKGLGSKGFMSVDKVDGDFVRWDITQEQIEKHISYLENIISWIDENCEVVSLDVKYLEEETKLEGLNVKLGISFIQSMLLAKQLNGIFLTDDYGLRMLSKNDYGIEGVCSQIFLQNLLFNNLIDKETYNKYIVQLLIYNYRHLAIDHHILFEAAKQSNWSPIYPFNAIIGILSGSDEAIYYTTRIAAEFIFGMWQQVISDEKRNALLFAVLENLTKGKNVSNVLKIFNTSLGIRFKLLPIALDEIQSLIQTWYDIHLT